MGNHKEHRDHKVTLRTISFFVVFVHFVVLTVDYDDVDYRFLGNDCERYF